MIELLLAVVIGRVEPLQAQIEPLTTRILDQRVRVETVEARGETMLAVSSDVLFAFDSAVIRPEARASLDAVRGRVGERCPRIVGHTDNRGSVRYNRTLSLQRALAAREALDRPCARVTGRGETDPVASNRRSSGRARNRRVEVTLLRQE